MPAKQNSLNKWKFGKGYRNKKQPPSDEGTCNRGVIMANFRRMKQQHRKNQEQKKKLQQGLFSFVFCSTILISVALLIVCAIYQKMLLWTEIAFTITWGFFTFFFGICLKKKFWFFSEAHFWTKVGWVNEKESRKTSVFEFGLSTTIFICFLIHLIVRLFV